MNKQEVIKRIESEKYIGLTTYEDDAYNEGLDDALLYVNQLDEPEKPALTKEEAEWVDKLTECYDLSDALYYITRCGYGNFLVFEIAHETYELPIENNMTFGEMCELKERLVNAVLYGYEVEKEKLYIAKLKSTKEYLNYDKDYKEIHHFKVPDDVASQVEAYHFTKDDLIKYHAWENEAYDINEVEE